MIEDYGPRIALNLLRARGEMGRWFGHDSIEGDFLAQRQNRAPWRSTRPRSGDARRLRRFAAGANRYIELHPDEFPAGFRRNFTGYDMPRAT